MHSDFLNALCILRTHAHTHKIFSLYFTQHTAHLLRTDKLVNVVQGNNSKLLYHTKQMNVQYRYNRVVTLNQVVHTVPSILNDLLLYWWYQLIIPINIPINMNTAQVKYLL